MTVGEIRKAIEGLPDEAFVTLMVCLSDETDGDYPGFIAMLENTFPEGGRLMILIGVDVTEGFDDDDDDDFEDEDDDDTSDESEAH